MSNREPLNTFREMFNGYVFELNTAEKLDPNITKQLCVKLLTWAHSDDAPTISNTASLCNILSQIISNETDVLEKFDFSVRVTGVFSPRSTRFNKETNTIVISLYRKSKLSIPDA